LTKLCAGLRKPTTRRTSSRRFNPGHSSSVGTCASSPAASGRIALQVLMPMASSTSAEATRASSVALPCSSTAAPSRASSKPSKGVSTGSLRAPL
jgi:hypothetical protein